MNHDRRSQPPRPHAPRFFGQYLLAEGYITAPQLLAALEYQEGLNARLGEYAVAMALITNFEAERIHALQVSEDLLFGEAAISLGLLDAEQVRQLTAAQRNDHVLLGEALTKLGYVEPEDIARALAALQQEPEAHEPMLAVQLDSSLSGRHVVDKTLYLMHRLLPRIWDLQNRPSTSRRVQEQLHLSDCNARALLQGPTLRSIAVGAPLEVAQRAVRLITGSQSPTEEECVGATVDLLQMLCINLSTTLAAEGIDLNASPAQACDFSIELPPDREAVVVPYVTHQGQVIVAIELARATPSDAQ